MRVCHQNQFTECKLSHRPTVSHAHTHLQRDDNHENLLFLVRQDVFNESPAGANQSQCDEQESALKPGKYINTNCKNQTQNILTLNFISWRNSTYKCVI